MTYLSLEIVSSHLGNKEDKMNNVFDDDEPNLC